jgi:hypothetical protein
MNKLYAYPGGDEVACGVHVGVSAVEAASYAAPRPWTLIDESNSAHPFVEIRSLGRISPIAYKYAPMPHEVQDFAHIVDCVNAIHDELDPRTPEYGVAT